MTHWKHILHITHLFTESEDPTDILQSMNKIADVIEKYEPLDGFDKVNDFRGCSDLNKANDLLNQLYDFCDNNHIWVEPTKRETKI